MNETQYTRKLRKRLEGKGYLVHKTSERFSAGWPDLVAIKDHVLFIEVKVGKNKLSKLQSLKLHEITNVGGLAFEVRWEKGEEIIYQFEGDSFSFDEHLLLERILLDD